MMNDLVLAELNTAWTALAKADTIQKTKNVLDVAIAAETYAKRQKLGSEIELQATSIKVEALRQLGNMLKDAPKNKGTRANGGDTGGAIIEPPDDTPTLAEMGLDKKISKLAQDVAKLTDDEIEKVKTGVTTASQLLRRVRRETKMQEISEGNRPLDTQDKKYSVVLADPPWRYDFSFSDSRAIEEHYPTMEIEDIMALPVHAILSDNAIIFLWCPPAFTKKAIAVVEAWGFEYRTNMVWIKPSIGAGQWVRQRHELLLIGRRGEIPTPEGSDRPDSVIEADRQGHSVKPECVYDIIEKMYPELDRVELFARNKRDGWDSWGNQS
jgi:N6-adenosine-specific RNA methylase IME4